MQYLPNLHIPLNSLFMHDAHFSKVIFLTLYYFKILQLCSKIYLKSEQNWEDLHFSFSFMEMISFMNGGGGGTNYHYNQ